MFVVFAKQLNNGGQLMFTAKGHAYVSHPLALATPTGPLLSASFWVFARKLVHGELTSPLALK